MNVEGVGHEERTVEFLEELEEYHSEDLLHLLACETCQGLARERIESTVSAPRMARPDYGVLLEELETRAPGLLKEKEEQDAEARALLDKLLGFGEVVDAAAELLRSYRRNPLLVFEGLPSPSSMG